MASWRNFLKEFSYQFPNNSHRSRQRKKISEEISKKNFWEIRNGIAEGVFIKVAEEIFKDIAEGILRIGERIVEVNSETNANVFVEEISIQIFANIHKKYLKGLQENMLKEFRKGFRKKFEEFKSNFKNSTKEVPWNIAEELSKGES